MTKDGQMDAPYETQLTPELAAQLLAKPHPKQRRPAKMTVAEYARRIREGRWRLVPDAIMIDQDGLMFNGAHRCAAVISANRAVPIYIQHGADADLFDVIDTGRFRSAYQFVPDRDPTAKASAARVTLWYERRFDRALAARYITFDTHEILKEVERRSEAFERVSAPSTAIYKYTSIPRSVSLGAFAIAEEMGYHEEIEAFADAIIDPSYLPTGDPARLLSERFRRQEHRAKRRQMVEDWTLLVYAFNLQIEGKEITKLVLNDVWPRVAEGSADFRRRANAIHETRRRGLQGRENHKAASAA